MNIESNEVDERISLTPYQKKSMKRKEKNYPQKSYNDNHIKMVVLH